MHETREHLHCSFRPNLHNHTPIKTLLSHKHTHVYAFITLKCSFTNKLPLDNPTSTFQELSGSPLHFISHSSISQLHTFFPPCPPLSPHHFPPPAVLSQFPPPTLPPKRPSHFLWPFISRSHSVFFHFLFEFQGH